MKKFLIIVIVVLVLGIGAIMFSLGGLIKTGVETVGPRITGTTVTLGSANISVLSGSAGLKELVVGSPAGSKSERTLRLGAVDVKLDMGSLTSDTIVIKEVSIAEPEISCDVGLRGCSNINAIQNNVEKSVSSEGSSSSESSETASSSSSKNVIIENLYVKGGKILPSIAGAGAPVSLPDIHLKDIGKNEGGTSFADATSEVLGALTKNVAKVDLSSIAGGITDNLQEAGDKLKEGLGGAGEAAEEGLDKLKGLF